MIASVLAQAISWAFLFLTLPWTFRISYSAIKMLRSRRFEELSTKDRPSIHIMLPVLNENERLRDFSDYFIKNCYQNAQYLNCT